MKKLEVILLVVLFFFGCTTFANAEIFLYEAESQITVSWSETSNEYDYYELMVYDLTNGEGQTDLRTFDTTYTITGLITHHIYSIYVYSILGVGRSQIGSEYICFGIDNNTATCICNCPECPEIPDPIYYVTTGGGWYTGLAFLNSTEQQQTIRVKVDNYTAVIGLSSMSATTNMLSRLLPDLPEGAHVMTFEAMEGVSIATCLSDGVQAFGQ